MTRRWFDEYEAAGCDGIICKQADGGYVEDKRLWIKWKHRRDADCVVGGYRVHKDGGKIGSILLGVYTDGGELHFVGHCSGFSDHGRVELLHQFEQLRSDESFGGDGAVRVPGAESRWSSGKDLSWIPVTPESLSRSATTSSRVPAFATLPASSAGAPTRSRRSAPWTN